MKKLVLCILLFGVLAGTGTAAAREKSGWTISLPGYNMGTTWSYYQPSLGVFQKDEIDSFLGLDPVKNHKVVWNPAFQVRYSITPNLQVGLHFNAQMDQWEKTVKLSTSTDTITNTRRTIASLESYLPSAVLLYRFPVGKGHFSIGGGIGYYVTRYTAGQETVTMIAPPSGTDTTTFGQVFGADIWAGGFGTQAFLEFTYPLFRDIFYISVRAGYVFCLIPRPMTIADNSKNYGYYLPDIDLSGWMGTIGFTAEF